MKRLLKGCGRLGGLFLVILLLAAVVGLSSPVSASEPPTITCTLDAVHDPGPPPMIILVTILTIEHDGQVTQVTFDRPPAGPLSDCSLFK